MKKLKEYLKTHRGRGAYYRIKAIKAAPTAFINHLDEQPELLTVQQVANFLGFSKKTIQNLIKYGFLLENNIGFILKSSLEKWLKDLIFYGE